jgi:two-component system, cell cycle response regulator DivK
MPSRNRPPPLVFVVDRDAENRERLLTCLNGSGVLAMEAANATDALERVAEAVPQAVLLDMGLPDVDPYELCRLLRDRPDTRWTPIIAVTGDASPADIKRAHDAGCNAVLVKPCPPEHVMLELHRVMPRHFQARR